MATSWHVGGQEGGKGRSIVRRGLVMGTGSATTGEGRKKGCGGAVLGTREPSPGDGMVSYMWGYRRLLRLAQGEEGTCGMERSGRAGWGWGGEASTALGRQAQVRARTSSSMFIG